MGAREGRYGCTGGPIIGFESRAILARVTKQIVTFFSRTCDNAGYQPGRADNQKAGNSVSHIQIPSYHG